MDGCRQHFSSSPAGQLVWPHVLSHLWIHVLSCSRAIKSAGGSFVCLCGLDLSTLLDLVFDVGIYVWFIMAVRWEIIAHQDQPSSFDSQAL